MMSIFAMWIWKIRWLQGKPHADMSELLFVCDSRNYVYLAMQKYTARLKWQLRFWKQINPINVEVHIGCYTLLRSEYVWALLKKVTDILDQYKENFSLCSKKWYNLTERKQVPVFAAFHL